YGMQPGDTVLGSITSNASGVFTITTTWKGQPTTFNTIPVPSQFTWANATLEVYTINTCNEFSSGAMTFSNMQILNSSGGAMTPAWIAAPSGGTTICNGQLIQNGNSMSIQENIYQDVNAGPIWNNQDAQQKCPQVCSNVSLQWSGQWQTPPGSSNSVCGCI
ncbi:MAG: mannan-binding lectin, partial [Undibacterium sp.]|nr:mannan-binding lectin [Undibacterium sp.]